MLSLIAVMLTKNTIMNRNKERTVKMLKGLLTKKWLKAPLITTNIVARIRLPRITLM